MLLAAPPTPACLAESVFILQNLCPATVDVFTPPPPTVLPGDRVAISIPRERMWKLMGSLEVAVNGARYFAFLTTTSPQRITPTVFAFATHAAHHTTQLTFTTATVLCNRTLLFLTVGNVVVPPGAYASYNDAPVETQYGTFAPPAFVAGTRALTATRTGEASVVLELTAATVRNQTPFDLTLTVERASVVIRPGTDECFPSPPRRGGRCRRSLRGPSPSASASATPSWSSSSTGS